MLNKNIEEALRNPAQSIIVGEIREIEANV